MKKKDMNKVVAVRVEGCFTEWYSPFYRDPYDTSASFRKYFDEVVLEKEPCTGPYVDYGDGNETITSNVHFLSERLMANVEEWGLATDEVERVIRFSLKHGVPYTVELFGEKIKVTPFKRGDMPKLDADKLNIFGVFAGFVKKRYDEI